MNTEIKNRKTAEAFKYLGPLISLIFVFILIFILEIISGLFSPPQNRLEIILAVLEQEPRLFWKQKSHLDTVFDDVPVRTNGLGLRDKEVSPKKEANVFRLVCLGASPTFGWGVDEEHVYSRQLEQLFNQESGQPRKVEVINAGVIGYSSHQGLRFFLEKIVPLSPDIITVSYVINDVDKHRFFRSNGLSDKELPDKSLMSVRLENLLDRSRAARLLRTVMARYQSPAIKVFGRSGYGRYNEKRRVPPEDYRANIKAIIQAAKERGIRVVLIKMPVNLASAEPVPLNLQDRADRFIEKALSLADAGHYEEAIAELKNAVADNPYSSKAFYYLGKYSEHLNNPGAAQGYFTAAVKMELFECEKLGKIYNKIMEETAVEEKVILVDLVSEFDGHRKSHSTPLFLEYKNDTIHPNRLGHEIISRAIYRALLNNAFLLSGEDLRS